MNKQLFDASDVAQSLKVSKAFVYMLIRTGVLTAVRLGKSVRVRPEDLDAMISGHLTSPIGLMGENEFLLYKRKLQ